jgi:ATP-binding cassette subfamily B protein
MSSSTRSLVSVFLVHRISFFKATGFSVLNKTFDVLPEILIGLAIDVVLQKNPSYLLQLGIDQPIHQLFALGAATLLIWIFESLFEFLLKIEWRNLAQKVQHQLRIQGWNSLLNQSSQWFDSQSTGKLISTVNDDVNQLERFANDGFNQLIQLCVSTLLIGAWFFISAPQLACIAILPAPVIIFAAFRFQKKIQPLYSKVREKAGVIASQLSNNIIGISTIKSYNAQTSETQRLVAMSEDYLDYNRKAIRVSSSFTPLIRMAVLSGFIVTLIWGGLQVFDGKISPGIYASLVFLTQRLLWPFTHLGAIADDFERAKSSYQRIQELIRLSQSKIGNSTPNAKSLASATVEFDQVQFSYPGREFSLEGIDFKVAPHSSLGVVGPTGSGKSTLLKLMLHILKPTQGQIRVGGVPLEEIPMDQLNSFVGWVSQDSWLFPGSLFENITWLKQEPAPHDIFWKKWENLLEITELAPFIQSLPQGRQTQVGERGVTLSGGQRQRIALARALFRDPKILILDEATSALDNETELAVHRTLEKLKSKTTIIMVAHRLSTVRNADQILVIEQGRIKAQGAHDSLLQTNALYRRLWSIQTGHLESSDLN